MSQLYPNSETVRQYQADLVEAKKELLAMCKDNNPTGYISMVRYNDAREKLKSKYDAQVIFMLDASGYVNQILHPEEKAWLKERNNRK